MQASREELVQRIMRFVPGDTVVQPFNGLFLARASRPLERIHSVVKPSFCVIAQGSKEILLGNNRYQYDPDHYLIATLELPRVSQILEASKELPYLSFRLELDSSVVSSVMMEADQFTPTDHIDVLALDVSPMDVNLQDAVVRLVRLLDSPVEAPVLMPLITREIVYRLLNVMLSEDLDAASTAYRLGYHDAAHFNREYKSLFGISPMRDVQRLRDAALSGANAT
jgi:AraC-like DNA-binding protein